MGGGDLLNLLIERDVFEEEFTRFYVAEVRLRHLEAPMHAYILRVWPDDSCHRGMSQARFHSS